MSTKAKVFTSALTVVALSVFAIGSTLLFMPCEVKAATPENAGVRSIEVSGTGSIKAKPDIAVLNVGVTTNGTSTSVQDDNTKMMNNVLASIKALGVDEKDIKTINYRMNPEYDYSNSKTANKIIGYTVYNMVEVKVRNINKAGEVLAAAVNAGANVNNGITFSLSNTEGYYNQALTKAMANAKGKADTLAKAAGVSIGVPSKIVEGSFYYPAPIANYNSMANGKAEMSDAAAVSQGEIEITANISVSYEY